MEMFLEQRIADTDPRLERVYAHFEANLTDMARAARSAGVPLVLSTVAVNLRDQVPFASLDEEQTSWKERRDLERGVEAAWEQLEAGDSTGALAAVDSLLASRGDHAEAHFLRGRALLALGRLEEAGESLELARDHDTLRFRADSRINEVIRAVAAAEGATLVDLAEHFRQGAGGEPLPGRRLFHEHVHLNFAGNHAAALHLLPAVDAHLPAAVGAPTPSLAAVAEHLAFTPFDAATMERDMLALVSRPPFVELVGQRQDLALRREALRRLERGLDAAAWERAEAVYRRRLERRPGDLLSRRRYAELLGARGRGEEAAALWAELLTDYPEVPAWYDARARALASAGNGDEALALLEAARRRFPEAAVEMWINEGTLHEAAAELATEEKDFREAAEHGQSARNAYRRALKAAPGRPEPLYNLATLEARNSKTDSSLRRLRQLVEEHPDFAPGHHNLGVGLERRGDLVGAAESFRWEIALTPENPEGYVALARTLRAEGDLQGAVGELTHALERDPGFAPALFELADIFYQSKRRRSDAAVLYRRGLEVEPSNAEARRRLAELTAGS
jgi:tetratricopeptide (TPR) repeat protein